MSVFCIIKTVENPAIFSGIWTLLKILQYFQEYGHKAAFYHGSMDPHQRAYIQKQWSKDEINIICATVAFGMGIASFIA